MQGFSQLVIRLLELLEAEGRAAGRATMRLVAALLAVAAAVVMVMVAVLLFAAALFILLAEALTVPGALGLIGLILLLGGFSCLLLAGILRKKKAGVK